MSGCFPGNRQPCVSAAGYSLNWQSVGLQNRRLGFDSLCPCHLTKSEANEMADKIKFMLALVSFGAGVAGFILLPTRR